VAGSPPRRGHACARTAAGADAASRRRPRSEEAHATPKRPASAVAMTTMSGASVTMSSTSPPKTTAVTAMISLSFVSPMMCAVVTTSS
jgi:hypothetical protein